ncbi:unnamed protein product [Prunus armeniaca]
MNNQYTIDKLAITSNRRTIYTQYTPNVYNVFSQKGCDSFSCALSKLRVDRSNCHKKIQIDEGSQRQQSFISQKSRSNCHKKELSNISKGRLFKRKKNPKTPNVRKIQRQKKARKKGSKKLTPPIEKQKNFKENQNQSRKKTQKLIQNETTQNNKISSY